MLHLNAACANAPDSGSHTYRRWRCVKNRTPGAVATGSTSVRLSRPTTSTSRASETSAGWNRIRARNAGNQRPYTAARPSVNQQSARHANVRRNDGLSPRTCSTPSIAITSENAPESIDVLAWLLLSTTEKPPMASRAACKPQERGKSAFATRTTSSHSFIVNFSILGLYWAQVSLCCMYVLSN
jgi:hypothetical protein